MRAAARALGPARGPRAVVLSPAGVAHPLQIYARGLRTLPPGAVRVREIDTIGMRSQDETFRDRFGVDARALHAPPGFRVASRVVTDRFTLVRLVAPAARFVTPRALGQLRLGRSDVGAAMEP